MISPVTINFVALANDVPAGILAGDAIVFVEMFNIDTTVTPLGMSVWYNVTQGTLTSATPLRSNLESAEQALRAGSGGGGSVTQGTSPWVVSQSGTWNLNNITGTISLPTGAATSALQSTANTTLSTINTTLGSPLQAGGNIVVTSAPTTAVTGTFWPATQPTSSTGVGVTTDQFNATNTWYSITGSLLLRFGLLIAGAIGAGSKAFTYNSDGTYNTIAWTILGLTKTRTYSYNSDGTFASWSDWV